MKRDAKGKLERHLAQTVDLRERLVYVGTADKVSGEGKVLSIVNPVPVTPDMTQEELNQALRDGAPNSARTYLQLPEEYQRVTTKPFAQLNIEDGQLRVMEPEWHMEEKGGYGVLCLEDKQDGVTSTYALSEGSTIESTLAAVEEGKRDEIKAIITFSPRGENPCVYNTTLEEWVRQYQTSEDEEN